MNSYEKIAKILRAKSETIKSLEQKLGALTGKSDVMAKILEENEAEIRHRLDFLGLGRNVGARQVYDGLISKIEADNDKLFKALGSPSALNPDDWQRVLETAKNIAGKPQGFFLKKEKAVELIKNQPPLNVIDVLGYKNVDEIINNKLKFKKKKYGY